MITDVLAGAVRQEQWSVARDAATALTAFGADAISALDVIRALARMPDRKPLAAVEDVRPAVVAALWAIGGDVGEVLPLALALLDDSGPFRITETADVLGRIGPAAAPALPRLRPLLVASYDWVRVHSAAAIWDIAGEAEAPAVLDTLLRAWEENDATAGHVIACLDRMGPAARPARPMLESWLARLKRGSPAADEELQCLGQAVMTRL